MKIKIISLLMTLVMIVGMLASCGGDGGNGGTTGGGDTPGGGSGDDGWRQTPLIFEMSENSNSGELTAGTKRYYAGESGKTDYIDELVKQRNDDAKVAANVRIEYIYLSDQISDYSWARNVDRIYNDTLTYGPGSVDMYCNFAYDMTCSAIKNCFANLKSTSYGEGRNYFEFNKPDYVGTGDNYFDADAGKGYFFDYMKSLSLSDDKLYCLGSNYCTDLVRSFLVIPVNINMMNQLEDEALPVGQKYDAETDSYIDIAKKDGQTNIQHFYDIVWGDAWTYDVLAAYSRLVFLDSNTNNGATASNLGDRLGFVLGGTSGLPAAGILYTTSVKIIQKVPVKDQPGKYDLVYPTTNPQFTEFATALYELMSENASLGITVATTAEASEYGKTDLQAIRNEFSKNNILFGGIIALGSLEDDVYQSMRAGNGAGFGIVPVPLYRQRSAEVTDVYNTLVHNLARIIGIASRTDKFEMCTKFLDYQSTHSKEILSTYYDDNLAAAVQGEVSEDNERMLNYIRNHVRDCFDKTYEDVIGNYNANDDSAALRRWHEILRMYRYQVTGMATVYGTYYSSKQDDITNTLKQWNELK